MINMYCFLLDSNFLNLLWEIFAKAHRSLEVCTEAYVNDDDLSCLCQWFDFAWNTQRFDESVDGCGETLNTEHQHPTSIRHQFYLLSIIKETLPGSSTKTTPRSAGRPESFTNQPCWSHKIYTSLHCGDGGGGTPNELTNFDIYLIESSVDV